MQIESTGNYSTRAHNTASVTELQETHCIGRIIHADGTEAPALWKIEDGAKIGGPDDDDLIQFLDTGISTINR